MEGQKANDASDASQDLVAEVAQPINKDGFYIAVVDFAERAVVIHNLEKATSLRGHLQPLGSRSWRNFFSGDTIGGTTNITDAIAQSRNILRRAEVNPPNPSVTFLRPVMILFSDGCHNEGPGPEPEADLLKQKADLVTVAFGNDADEELLRKLASTPQHFYRCSNGRELRQFLATVGATLTQTMAQRTNATRALASIQQ